MKIKALKPFSGKEGIVTRGTEWDAAEDRAAELIKVGLVEEVKAKKKTKK